MGRLGQFPLAQQMRLTIFMTSWIPIVQSLAHYCFASRVAGTDALAPLTFCLQLRQFGALVGPQDFCDAVHTVSAAGNARKG
jgi:hypothetical protein